MTTNQSSYAPGPISPFEEQVEVLLQRYRPSKHPFFLRLQKAPSRVITSGRFMREFYLRYQAAMHATRVMVYFLPHLDSVTLRTRKLRIIAEDDGIEGGDTHHAQLRRTWNQLMHGALNISDEEFGELDELKRRVDPATGDFLTRVQSLYPQTLGPWVVVEGLAHDWIGGLHDSLAPHFPLVSETDYFTQNYFNGIEEQHAREAVEVTQLVLARQPELTGLTIEGARRMGEALNALWSGFDDMLVCALKPEVVS